MNELASIEIHDLYLKIISQISGGSIFGEPIDLDNREMVIVAAYLLGDLKWFSRNSTIAEVTK